MMYSKIALANVKKSFKDYMIYFLTLTFAVCIFYSFNSIHAQEVMFEMNDYPAHFMGLLTQIIGIVSVFVSAILGGLILYGNNFLIKRRKKELGIYMTLGMPKNKIAKILFFETTIIGVMALAVGLVVGVLGSQALSLFTAKLFEFDLNSYRFIFSSTAVIKTIIYFGVIFLLVMLFNTAVLSKYKLIDLLQAAKKSESVKLKNQVLSSILFVSGIVILGVAYSLIKKVGLNPDAPQFWISIGLGCVGTLLYFLSLTGFVIEMIQKNKRVYLKGLNPFILRQLGSKVNTNIMSMTVICLMLFLTITGLSTGLSFKNVLEKGLEETTPYDASVSIYQDAELEKIFESLGVAFEGSEVYSVYKEYDLGLSISDLEGSAANQGNDKRCVWAVSVSHYNELVQLQGKAPITLAEDEIVLTSNNTTMIPTIQEVIEQGNPITIQDQAYKIKNKEVEVVTLSSSGFSNNFCTMIVPDKVVEGKEADSTNMNINYGEENREQSEAKFSEVFVSYRLGSYKGEKLDYDEFGFLVGDTKEAIYLANQEMKMVILFVGIYLSIVFLISSAAVLALQQLTEASDSSERYESLKRIGVSEQMIHKIILKQTLIYFMLPLSLAWVHAFVGIGVANDFLAMYNNPEIGTSALITVVMLTMIYGGYCYTTYIGYKNIVSSKK